MMYLALAIILSSARDQAGRQGKADGRLGYTGVRQGRQAADREGDRGAGER